MAILKNSISEILFPLKYKGWIIQKYIPKIKVIQNRNEYDTSNEYVLKYKGYLKTKSFLKAKKENQVLLVEDFSLSIALYRIQQRINQI